MSDDLGELEFGEDAAWIAAGLVLVAGIGGAVVLAEWPLVGVTPDEPDEPNLVEPAEDGSILWPSTARTQAFETRTLGINMVFFGDPDAVHTALTERTDREWTDEQLHEGDADEETVSHERVQFDPEADSIEDFIRFEDAEGSTRYSYVEVDGEGEWLDESYQLHSGTYLGHRMHIRAYEDPAGEWTAVQVHDEHWDWFRLRHTVTGISDAQRELETDFMGQPDVDAVIRIPFENETADGDGWASGIFIAGTIVPLFLLGFTLRTRKMARNTRQFLRQHRREIALGVGLFTLYTAVRWLGIVGEMVFSGVSPKVVAAPLYLAVVVGTPAIAYLFGRGSETTWAFAFAVLGLGAAFVVDFAAMGVSVLPLRVVLHRGAVLIAIGLVAVGGAFVAEREERPIPLFIGLVGWALGLFTPLFGYI